jgi:hypothetical protein
MSTKKAERRALGRELRKTFKLEFTLAHSIAKATCRIAGECTLNGVTILLRSSKAPPKVKALLESGFAFASVANRGCGNPECCGYYYPGTLRFGQIEVEVS